MAYLKKRLQSFGYAFKGIATLIRTQPNAQIHLLATVVVVAAGVFFEVGRGEWTALLLAMALVWTAEALNTAVEFLTDLVSPDPHPLAGKAKDVAASAVLIAAIFAVAVAVFVFWPYVSARF